MIAPTAAPLAAPFTAAPLATESTCAAACLPAACTSFWLFGLTPACSALHSRHASSSASCCSGVCPLAGKATKPSFCIASFIDICGAGAAGGGVLVVVVVVVVVCAGGGVSVA